MEKRGLSAVVTTVIMVLLVIVAIGIVWGVISNLINNTTKDISSDKFTNQIQIDSAYYNQTSLSASVKIHRSKGNSDMTSLKLIFTNSTDSYSFDQTANLPGEFETRTYTIDLSTSMANPDEITAVPFYGETAGLEVREKF